MAKDLTKRQRFWLSHVRAASTSGEPLQRYAKRHRLSIGALYNARSVLKRDGALEHNTLPVADFVAVKIATPMPRPIACQLQHVRGWQLVMEQLPDPQWLLALMRDDDAAT